MIKHIVLDVGGVIVYPRLGEWNIPFGAAAILGERAKDIASAKYLIAHRNAVHWLDESQRLEGVEEERILRRSYIREMDEQMGWNLTEEEIDRLGDDFTDNINRYGFFNDVLPWLNRWRGAYTVSVLSDCLPSLRGFLEQWGVTPYLKAQIYSFAVGATKPDPGMYAALLDALQAPAEECLFVDDRVDNLLGAQEAGLQAVQMARPEFLPAQVWDGPVVHTFEALNAHIDKLNRG